MSPHVFPSRDSTGRGPSLGVTAHGHGWSCPGAVRACNLCHPLLPPHPISGNVKTADPGKCAGRRRAPTATRPPSRLRRPDLLGQFPRRTLAAFLPTSFTQRSSTGAGIGGVAAPGSAEVQDTSPRGRTRDCFPSVERTRIVDERQLQKAGEGPSWRVLVRTAVRSRSDALFPAEYPSDTQ